MGPLIIFYIMRGRNESKDVKKNNNSPEI